MKPHPFDLESDQWLAERHAAAMDKSTAYNTDRTIWEEAAKLYRARPDGGPTIRALEGNLWGIPKLGWVARFESTEEAELVLLAAGFRLIPEEKGFRA
jgi:hypothetical protein